MSKILIIEDDIAITNTIIDLLETEGYEVNTVTNGEDGVKHAKSFLPDLIICDISLPGINGFEVFSRLSKDEKMMKIPFVYLSARVSNEDVRHGMTLGADDYITKPFKISELLRVIEIRLKKNKILRSSENLDEEKKDKKLDDEEHILISVNDKPKFLKIRDIKCITAEAEYSNVYTQDGEKYLVRKLMKSWEEILPENTFLRIHRSTIININFIEKMDKWFNHSFIIYMQNEKEPFVASRRYATSIRSRLG